MPLDDYKPVNEGTKIGKVLSWLVGTVAIVGLIALIVWSVKYGLEYKNRNDRIASEIKSFDGSIDQYIIPSSQLADTPDDKLYINGKVIVINRQEKAIDPIYYELPDDLRATKPEEVGTIVWLDWGNKFVSRYTNGAVGYAHAVRVSIIDKSKMALVDSKVFIGSDPPNDTKASGDVYGTKPVRKIVTYIQGAKRGEIVYAPNEPPPMSASSKNALARLIGYAVMFGIMAIVGWWVTRKLKKNMGKRLGREVYGEHELTSISSWIEASRKDEARSTDKR